MSDGRVVRVPAPPHRCVPPMVNQQPWVDGAVAVEGTIWECRCGRQYRAEWANLWPYFGSNGTHRAEYGNWRRKWLRVRS